jgi:type IV secretion system protein VirB9
VKSVPGRSVAGCELRTVVVVLVAFVSARAWGAGNGSVSSVDSRIRTQDYASDSVYRLRGYVGYQIDIEFEPGEAFVGLGAGDIDSIAFAAQSNHLFLKPRATAVETNITVLTNLRTYHFDYFSSAAAPEPDLHDVIYVLKFHYPSDRATAEDRRVVDQRLATAGDVRRHNLEYTYCGSRELKPDAAWDDGVQTHLSFPGGNELPAVFARNDDGSESLVNFSVEGPELVIHRVSRRFIVRRGRLVGCVVNRAYGVSGQQLQSGTVTPAVERSLRARPQ